MSVGVEGQLKKNTDVCEYFCNRLDEQTDVVDCVF